MDTDKFIADYLKPSAGGLDRTYTLPLPPIDGLTKTAEFIVQGHQDRTFSTNIMTTYQSAAQDIRLVEVYKNTQDQVEGIFVRLVGTICVLKPGYPFVFLDAAVSNINMKTARQDGVTTRAAVHMPQADPRGRNVLFDRLSRRAQEKGITCERKEIPQLPVFWGPLWSARAEGIDLDMVRTLRSWTCAEYQYYCSQAEKTPEFDYRPTQEHMILKHSIAEHHLFHTMGLSVPVEAQAAFFSVLVTGV